MPKNELAEKLGALPVFEYRGQLVADSRDVAAMIGRQHKDTLRTVSSILLGEKLRSVTSSSRPRTKTAPDVLCPATTSQKWAVRWWRTSRRARPGRYSRRSMSRRFIPCGTSSESGSLRSGRTPAQNSPGDLLKRG